MLFRVARSARIHLSITAMLLAGLQVPTARAQVAILAGSVYQRAMGFQPTAPLIGVDWSTAHISQTAWWSPADKYIGNGWTATEQGAYYFNHGAFGAGPAALVRFTDTSEWHKTSFYPSFAAQCRAYGWRIEAFAHFRDQWTQNHGRGVSVVVRREIPLPFSRVGAAFRGGIMVMKFSDGFPEPYGTVAQFGMLIYRRSVRAR